MSRSADKQSSTAANGDNDPVTLSSIRPGTSARVVSVDDSGRVGRRLQEMGIVPGVEVRVVKTAPFGDPFELRVMGYKLALRRSEASVVFVTPV